MKVCVISDTHENMPVIDRAVEICAKENVKLVIHCGDFISPITAGHFNNLNCRMEGVFGNNDGDKLFLLKRYEGVASIHHSPFSLEIEDKRIVLMHEPDLLEDLISGGKADFIFYGHTHYLDIREGSTLVVNPGEAGGWLTGRSTMAMVDTETKTVNIIDL